MGSIVPDDDYMLYTQTTSARFRGRAIGSGETVSILSRVREAFEAQALQRRADVAFSRVQETIASQLAQELTEEDTGWRKLSDGAGGYDLSLRELSTIRSKCIKAWQIDPSLGQAASLLVSGAFGKGLDTPRAADSRVQEVGPPVGGGTTAWPCFRATPWRAPATP